MIKRTFITSLALLLFISIFAWADRRNFAWTYEYKTMAKGEAEIEHYLTPSVDEENAISWSHQVEVEYGITNRFDASVYQMFGQKPEGFLKYEGYKLRGRYRFGEQGLYPLDPLIYLEFVQKPNEIEFEEKLVLGKVFGKSFMAANLTLEQEIEKEEEERELEFIINPTLGIGYQLKPYFSVGLEFYSHTEILEGEVEHTAIFSGPTISLAGRKVWWTLSFLPQLTGITDEHDKLMVRSLLGIFL